MRGARRSLDKEWAWAAPACTGVSPAATGESPCAVVSVDASADLWNAARRCVANFGEANLRVPRSALEELRRQRAPPAAARTVLSCACSMLSADRGCADPPVCWEATQQALRRPDFLRHACACDPVVLLVRLHRSTMALEHARACVAPARCNGGDAVRWRDAVAASRRFAEDWSAGDLPPGPPSLLDVSYCSGSAHNLF
eukprot:5636548-Prymnesium_polylepis.1